MAFQIGASRANLSGPKPLDTNIYELQVAGFKPKIAKSGTSLNYNAEFTVINDPANEGRKVFAPLTTSFFTAIRDFVHATGNLCETVQVVNETTGEIEEHFVMPGQFENQAENPQSPELWGAYVGPLTNATFKAEVVLTDYMGKPKNEIRQFFCTVPNCSEIEPDLRHSSSLIKK